MAGRIILDCPNPSLDSNGDVDSAATLTYYENGTTTLQSIYSDSDLGTPLANPLSPDAAGRFADVWCNSGNVYSVKWVRGDGTTKTFDDIWPLTGGGAQDYTPEDFGALADGATDDSLAIYNATIAAQALGTNVIFQTGASYYINGAQPLVFGSKASPLHNIRWKSSGGGYATILVGAGAVTRAIIFRYADGLRSSGIWIKGDNANAAQNLLCIENTSDVLWENFKVSDQTGQSYGIVVSEDTSLTQSFAPATLTGVFTITNAYVSGNTVVSKGGGSAQSFAASDVDTATGKITLTAHCLVNGEAVQYTESDAAPGPTTITPPSCASGSMPYFQASSGLNHSFIYFAHYEDANTVRLCLTKADALASQTTCAAASVTTATDTITVANHGYTDDNSVVATSSGGLPAGLTSGNRYWIKKVDANNFQLRTDSPAGAIVDLTTQGTGTHTFTPWIIYASAGSTPGSARNQLRGLGWQLQEGTDFTVSGGGTIITLAGNLSGGIGFADGSLAIRAAYGTACDNVKFRHGVIKNMGYSGMELYPKLASVDMLVEDVYVENCGTADSSMAGIKGPSNVTGAQVKNVRIKGGNNGYNPGGYNDTQVSGLQLWNQNYSSLLITVSQEVIATVTRASLSISDFAIWNDSGFTPSPGGPSIGINGASVSNGPVKLSNFSIHNTPWWVQVAPQQAVRDIIMENFDCIGISANGITSAIPIVVSATNGAMPLAFKMRNFFLKQFGFDGTASVIIGSHSTLVENGRFMGMGAGNPGTGALILTGDQSEVLNVTFDRCNPSSAQPAIQVQDTIAAHSYLISSSFYNNRATGLVSTLYHSTGATVTVSSSPGVQPVSAGGTGLTAGTSGGVPYYSSSSAMASSAALTANRLVLGGGAGAAPTVAASLGTTTTVLHGNAAGAPTFGAVSLTADVSGILPGANGGTNNGFMAFSGPTTALKTFALPDASTTILTTNAAVTVAQGGTGIATGTSGGVPYFSGTATIASSGALAANGVVLGGGAGATPTATAQFSFNAATGFLTVQGSGSNPPAALTGQVAEYSAPDSANEAFYVWRATGNDPAHLFMRANGTTGSLTNVVSGNVIGRLYFGGYDGTNWQSGAGLIRFIADGDWSGTARGAYVEVFGTPNAGTTSTSLIYASTNYLSPRNNTLFGGIYSAGGATATQPSLLPRTADTTTGIGSSGSGIIDGIISGTTSYILNSNGLEVKKSLRSSTVTALTTSGTVSLDPTLGNVFTCTPSADITALNAASVPAGQEIAIIFTTSGTSSFTVTFNTGFKTTATLATGTVSGKVFVMKFVSNGTTFFEASRTAAM